jgi:2-phosphosulfolactate phosphatase
MKIKTILTPAELPRLAQRDLHQTACVVFDILRATSTFVTALHHGATAIVPVSEIAEAIALRNRQPEVLLAGERDGLKIRAAIASGIDFNFGNSPREFTAEMVCGKTIVSTTTNGTRALRACAGAKCMLAAAFLNLTATAEFLRRKSFAEILLVCAGTGDGVALEDVLAAGAMIELFTARGDARPTLSDSSQVAWKNFSNRKLDSTEGLSAAIGDSQNGRRLLAIPDLRDDVAFCAQRDIVDLVAGLGADGWLRQIRA